jgi:hypothetical protein
MAKEVLRTLREEEGYLSEIPRPRVAKLGEAMGIKAERDLWEFVMEVVDEAAKEMRVALDGLWRSFGFRRLPREVEVATTNGEWVKVLYPSHKGAPWMQVDTKSYRTLLQPTRSPDGGFAFEIQVWPTLVEAGVRSGGGGTATPELFVVGERAVFRAEDLERVRKVSEGVRYLGPFFSAIGLGDLREALKELAALGDGEVRARGEYTLARKGERRVLGRGRFLGDPELDGTLLLGERVRLSFPGDVELSFKGRFNGFAVSLREVEVRWGEDVARFDQYAVFSSNLHRRDPVGDAIRSIFVSENLRMRVHGKLTPKMEALFRALARSEDPIELLRSGKFAPHAVAEFFVDL